MAENADGAERCAFCNEEMNLQNRVHQLPVMTILNGRYLTGKVLGEGGFGITYIGYDFVMREKVAIKEYYPSGISTRYATYSLTVEATSKSSDVILAEGRKKFLEEAQAMRRFQKIPSIVDVNDFFYANGTAYIIMEYLDGQSMQAWMKENGPEKDFDKLFAMLRPVMEGLAEVHKTGLIHRDISPSNMMLLQDGTVKLLDFGTARQVNEDGEKSLSVVLKPGFAPEEQYRRHGKQGPWTDIYALCATMYKLLTGVTPEISMDRLAEDNLARPSELGVKIKPWQEAALIQGMAVRQEDRIQSVDELIEMLSVPHKGKIQKTNSTKEGKAGKPPAAGENKKAGKGKAFFSLCRDVFCIPDMGVPLIAQPKEKKDCGKKERILRILCRVLYELLLVLPLALLTALALIPLFYSNQRLQDVDIFLFAVLAMLYRLATLWPKTQYPSSGVLRGLRVVRKGYLAILEAHLVCMIAALAFWVESYSQTAYRIVEDLIHNPWRYRTTVSLLVMLAALTTLLAALAPTAVFAKATKTGFIKALGVRVLIMCVEGGLLFSLIMLLG